MARKKKTTAMKRRPGRPSIYSDAICEEICLRLAAGESLVKICDSPHLPDRVTVIRWLIDPAKTLFRNSYTEARAAQAELLADEMLSIADDSRNDFMERLAKNGEIEQVPNWEHVNRSRLRVDARKFVMEQLRPKVHGVPPQRGRAGVRLPDGTVIGLEWGEVGELGEAELEARVQALLDQRQALQAQAVDAQEGEEETENQRGGREGREREDARRAREAKAKAKVAVE